MFLISKDFGKRIAETFQVSKKLSLCPKSENHCTPVYQLLFIYLFIFFVWTKVHFVEPLIAPVLDFVCPSSWVSNPERISCLHSFLLACCDPEGCYLFHCSLNCIGSYFWLSCYVVECLLGCILFNLHLFNPFLGRGEYESKCVMHDLRNLCGYILIASCDLHFQYGELKHSTYSVDTVTLIATLVMYVCEHHP